MTRVRYLTCMVGDRDVRNQGDERDVDDDEAGRLVAAGFAETEDGSPPPKPKAPAKRGRKTKSPEPTGPAEGDKLPDLETGDDDKE